MSVYTYKVGNVYAANMQYATYYVLSLGLLYPIGEDIVQYTPPENVTLKVGLTPSPASYYFRLLTWYHDGVELVDGGRITLNDLNTTITMTDTSEDDSGIYEARYNGLLVRPYDRGCERDIIDLLRHYPLLKPVVFHVNTEPSGKFV